MGELTYGGEDKNLVGGESTGGIFPGGGNEQISAGGRSLAPSFPVGKPIYIYIYNSTSLCTDPFCKPLPSNYFCPEVLKNLISCPRQTKDPDDSNVLLMFNNNTYIDFRTAYKHVLIPSYYNEVI